MGPVQVTHSFPQQQSSPKHRAMAAAALPDLLQKGFPLPPASLAVLFSILLSAVLLIGYYSNLYFPRGRPKLPPSPPKLPLIGNLHQLCRLSHLSLRDLSRRYGPLMLLQLGQVPTLVVSSAETAREVLKVHDLAFASRPRSRVAAAIAPGCKAIGWAPYGEYWRQARRVCAVHLLSPHRVQRFRPAREEEVARLVGKISALSSSGEPINVSRLLSSFTNSVICRAAMGESAVEEATKGEISELVVRTVAVGRDFQVDTFFPSLAWLDKFTGMDAKVAELAGRWHTFLGKLVEKAARRREAGEFLDILLSLQRDDAAVGFVPSDDEVQSILLSVIIAGTNTTSLVLQGALEELARNPQAMKKAQEEVRGVVVPGKPNPLLVTEDDTSQMAYLTAVMKETLRLHMPAPLLMARESMKDVQMRGGYEIPSKTRVVINAWEIARDPDFWESPEEFRPERFLKSNSVDFRGNDFHFIPFGSGRRICPGMHFAVVNMELALANLLSHFDWSLPEANTAEVLLGTDQPPGHAVQGMPGLLLVAKPKPWPLESSAR